MQVLTCLLRDNMRGRSIVWQYLHASWQVGIGCCK